MSRLRSRTHSPALVVSVVALIVALGGTSYAAFALPKNSVGSKQLKNKAVTPRKVAPKTIALFKGQKGDTGDRGPQGLQGIQGQPGPGATTFSQILPHSTAPTALAEVGNGVTISGGCGASGQVTISLSLADTSDVVNYAVEYSRVTTPDNTVHFASGIANPFSLSDSNEVLVSGLVSDVGTNSKPAHIDVSGATGPSCSFQGMIIPSG